MFLDAIWKKLHEGLLLRAISLIIFIFLWYGFVLVARERILSIPGIRLSSVPTPLEVWDAFLSSLFTRTYGPVVSYGLTDHTIASLWRVLKGLVAAVIIGAPLGLGIGYFKSVNDFFRPTIEVLRQIPPIAWIPLAVFILVYGKAVFIVFIGIIFPLILNTVHGVQSVDTKLIDVAHTLGADEKDIVLKVILPASLPSILAGLRIGLGVGWMCIVAAEMVIEMPIGLGYHIWNMGSIGKYPEMVAGMVVIGAIGYLMNGMILFTEERLLEWR